MFHYVAIAWNTSDHYQCRLASLLADRILAASPHLTPLVHIAGLSIFVIANQDMRPRYICFLNGTGIVLGNIYSSRTGDEVTSSPPLNILTPADEIEISRTHGRSICSSHWGDYVLFTHDRSSESTYVLRGPLSNIPCFWVDRFGLTVLFSDLEWVAGLGLIPLAINWGQIRAQAVRGDYLGAETALQGVSTLVSGDCLELHQSLRRRHQYWTPSAALAKDVPTDIDTAAGVLRSSVQSAINALAAPHDTIVASLSGGFDSSTVLACLASVPSTPRLVAANFYSSHSDDERQYARTMAKKVGASIVEIRRAAHFDLRALLKCSHTVNPVDNSHPLITESRVVELCQGIHATAVFNGQLGDDVFGHASGPEYLAELLWRYKVGDRTGRCLLDYATLYRISVWKAARLAISEYRRYRRPGFWRRYHMSSTSNPTSTRSMATNDAIMLYEDNIQQFVHPWLCALDKAPPAWLQTVFGLILLTAPTTHADFYAKQGITYYCPLTTQPVIEASLTIPPDYHLSADQNAVAARRAFAPMLSATVLERGTSKGTREVWLRELIRENSAFVRELLLDGILAKMGILDRQKTEAALSGGVTASKAPVSDILTQLAIECWLQHWTTHRYFGNNNPGVLQLQ